jgi:hypothetical protein
MKELPSQELLEAAEAFLDGMMIPPETEELRHLVKAAATHRAVWYGTRGPSCVSFGNV